MAELDAAGTVIGWTGAAERLLGHQAEEILNRPAAQLPAIPGDEAGVAAVAEWVPRGRRLERIGRGAPP